MYIPIWVVTPTPHVQACVFKFWRFAWLIPLFNQEETGLVAIADLSCGLLVEMDFDRDGLWEVPLKVCPFSWKPITSFDKWIEIYCWVVVSNMFYFHPYLGKIPILTNIFHMGWNHQPDRDSLRCSVSKHLHFLLRCLCFQAKGFDLSIENRETSALGPLQKYSYVSRG